MSVTVCVIFLVFMSIVAHEVAHGYVAYRLGDPTAKMHGRLTMNPLAHVDLVGTIILPLFMYFTSGFIFGWAKPVPVNPRNFKNPVRDFGIVGAAGPAANIAIAVALGIFARSVLFFGLMPLGTESLAATAIEIAFYVAMINILLALFNLIPLPPLDGSRILFAVLPQKWQSAQDVLEKFGIVGMFLAFGIIYYYFEVFRYATYEIARLIFGFYSFHI
ncbi:MAG: site-2 protease family protein [Candidatus Niyogibacteria bacterium]|nr:site-2 protease family protein [Candidatus Niyogibacteria bacterium]